MNAKVKPYSFDPVHWSYEYPCAVIPTGLRRIEVKWVHRLMGDGAQVAVHTFEWPIVLASRDKTTGAWSYQVAKAFAHQSITNGGEVSSGVIGAFNQTLDRKLWRLWGPFQWCGFTPITGEAIVVPEKTPG